MIRIPLRCARWALAFSALAAAAPAQEQPPEVIPIVLRPAPAPVPALKYRLLPERSAQQPGNAAIFYHRAIEAMVQSRRVSVGGPKQAPGERPDEESVPEWLAGSLATIPLDRARGWLDRNRRALREVELGARRLACDWGFDARTEGIDLVIDEIQQMRSLVRLVALRARISVVEKKPDDAVNWLQTGYAMARHVCQGPIFVQALIGVNVGFSLVKPTEDLIQSPGMPSLYWALADRPHPLLEIAPTLEGERFLLEREIPALRDLDGLPWSVAKVRVFADELQAKLYRFAEWRGLGSLTWGEPETRDWFNRLGIAAMVAQAYPEAKRSLIARGRTPAEVEAMPAVQVVFLETYQAYQAYRDDIFKWSGLPFPAAYEGMSRSVGRLSEIRGKPLLSLFCSIFSSIQGGIMAEARLERRLDAIQSIEAIRLYAASHGRLPARLEDLNDSPAPLDPMTGRPFEYKLESGRALLSAPVAPPGFQHPSFSIQYELKPGS
jgi:hypothetical protein